MRAFGIFCVLALCAAHATAQREPERATKALELFPGLGDYHHSITTKNPETQTYFDQGLTLLYGFNHAEAARYFRRAAELDHDAAMPYWGLALAIGPNYNDTAVDEDRASATYDAVQKAVEREWNRAVDLESAIRYDEPPPWFFPVWESLGATLLRNGQAKAAESVFRTAFEKRPRDGRLLFGLWQSLMAQGRDNEAALVEQQFHAAWKDASVKLRIEDL